MSNRVAKLSVLLLSYSLLSWGAEAPWQTYSIKNYPASELGCVQTAKKMAENFEKVTGQSVYRASCEAQSAKGYDLLITYVAVTPVSVVSTASESGGSGYLGVYGSLSDCRATLSREVEKFSSATGLAPFVSYCYKESDLSQTPYFARIDAFGNAKLYPYRFEHSVFADSIKGSAEILQRLLSAAQAAGIAVHQATFAHDGNLKLVIRYYGSPQDVIFHSGYFKLKEAAHYSSQGTRAPFEACERQRTEAEKGFSAAYATPGIWFCTWDRLLFQARLYLLRVQPQEWIKTDTIPDRYATFDACDRERPATYAFYEKTFGVAPFSILCSWKSGFGTGKPDAFVMKVLTKTTEPELPFDFDPDLGWATQPTSAENTL